MFARVLKAGLGLAIVGAVLPLAATSAHADSPRLQLSTTGPIVLVTYHTPFSTPVALTFNKGLIFSSVPLDVQPGTCVGVGHTPWGYAADCTQGKFFYLSTSRGDDTIVADVAAGQAVTLVGDRGKDTSR